MTRYLGALPAGLESHPACTVHESVLDAYVRDHAALATERDLPEAVRHLFAGPSRGWVSEVRFQAAHLAVLDQRFGGNEQSLDQWTRRTTEELFDKPFARVLMRLMSPTLLILGSARRWKTFHQGSTLHAGPATDLGDRSSVESELRFPSGLMSDVFLRGLCIAFGVALESSRAQAPRVDLVDVRPEVARYRIEWTR